MKLGRDFAVKLGSKKAGWFQSDVVPLAAATALLDVAIHFQHPAEQLVRDRRVLVAFAPKAVQVQELRGQHTSRWNAVGALIQELNHDVSFVIAKRRSFRFGNQDIFVRNIADICNVVTAVRAVETFHKCHCISHQACFSVTKPVILPSHCKSDTWSLRRRTPVTNSDHPVTNKKTHCHCKKSRKRTAKRVTVTNSDHVPLLPDTSKRGHNDFKNAIPTLIEGNFRHCGHCSPIRSAR